jgi:hypothetical protein
MNKLKNKLIGSRAWGLYLAACVLAAAVLTAPRASATFTPVSVDPADAISQVTATAGDLLPFAMVMAGAGLVFKLIRRFVR